MPDIAESRNAALSAPLGMARLLDQQRAEAAHRNDLCPSSRRFVEGVALRDATAARVLLRGRRIEYKTKD